VVILAETLRRIHRINTTGCPVDNRIENRVEKLVADGVDVSSLGDRRQEEVPCFTHGDFCLPNIIVKENRLSGVIDWDYAGLADPYTDLVSCLWSIRYNYKEKTEELLQLFLETYGVEPDPVKLDYYQRLNELIP
jgi:aminoglycoside phosphotransferase